jgi:hypothetical protein
MFVEPAPDGLAVDTPVAPPYDGYSGAGPGPSALPEDLGDWQYQPPPGTALADRAAPAVEAPGVPDSYWGGPAAVPPPGDLGGPDPSGPGEFSPTVLGQPGWEPVAADWLADPAVGALVAERTASADEGALAVAGGTPEAAPPVGDLAAPVPAEAAAYAAEATADEDEDMGWEGPPEIGPDGRGPWLDGPDAPWGTAPAQSGRRALVAGAWGVGVGLAFALVRLFLLN